MKKIELKVTDPVFCKSLQDPTQQGVVHIEAYLPFDEANKLKRGNANVRPPDAKRRPFKAMLNTVEESPETFQLKNRGITFICPEGKYDEKTGIITLSIPEKKDTFEIDDEKTPKYGIADGGHTFEVINQVIRNRKEYEDVGKRWQMPFVKVHVIVTKDTDVEPIVEALNTSLQVQAYTLDEYQGKFQHLKDALEKADFDPNLVSWREGEDKEWHVIEVIQRLSCFLKDRWVTTQPAGMYKSKGKALRLYTNEETREEFEALNHVIKDILTLPEYIQSEFSRGGFINAKSLGKLKCVKPLKKKGPIVRPGTNYPSDHKIDLAALLPIAAGFRELLVKRGDFYEWRLPYKEIFKQCAEDLYNHLQNRVGLVALSNQLSSDIEYWSGCVLLITRARQQSQDDFPPEKVITRKKGKLVAQNGGQDDDTQDTVAYPEENQALQVDADDDNA